MAAWLLLAGIAAASVTDTNVECFRADLDAFMADLQELPGFVPSEIAEARQLVAAAPAEFLLPMQEGLAGAANWRALPQVLADSSRLIEQRRAEELRQIISEAVSGPPKLADPAAGPDPEQIRGNLIFFASLLRTPVAAHARPPLFIWRPLQS